MLHQKFEKGENKKKTDFGCLNRDWQSIKIHWVRHSALVGKYFLHDLSILFRIINPLRSHILIFIAVSDLITLCNYRHYDDKAAEAGQGFWNCPCVPMRER